MNIIALVGKVLTIYDNLKLRFINQYKLSRIAKHGINCHIEGG